MRKREKRSTGLLRLALTLMLLLGVLAGLTRGMPWHFPYDRLNHLYAVEGVESVEEGHPGGEFVLLSEPIHEEAAVELMVDGKVYTKAEPDGAGRFRVYLGEELFDAPRKLQLTLRECYLPPVYLRSNTIHLYVTPRAGN